MKAKKQTSGRTSLPKTALPRIYKIDAAIAAGKFPNSGDLARLCETSISTISRDIEFMRDQLLAPIEYDSFHRGYYYTEKLYRLPAGFTSAEDLLALGMAKNILSLYRDTPLFNAANHLLESIIAPISGDGNKGCLEDRIVVPKIASAKIKPEIWDIVVAALKGNRVITFDYMSEWQDDYENRRVRPYQLLFDSGMWYLHGFAEERRAIRMFALSRMKNVKLTINVFALPTNFSYANWSGDSYFGVFIGREKYHFVIDCYGNAAVSAGERQWAADQKISDIEDGIRFEFTSTQFEKILRWVLSNGINAVPREPQILVDEWKYQITEAYKFFSEN